MISGFKFKTIILLSLIIDTLPKTPSGFCRFIGFACRRGFRRCVKTFLIFFIVASVVTFCSVQVRSEFYNPVSPQEGEINFGRLAPIPFKFSYSSCYNESVCAYNLFDSNQNTIWMPDKKANEEWIIIDFSSKRLISGVELEFEKDSNLLDYHIQVLKREVWTTISFQSRPGIRTLTQLAGIDASTIRILFPDTFNKSFSVSSLKLLLGTKNITGIDRRFTGYQFPIDGGIIPSDDYALPGAPRKYRNGIHKGLDISLRKNLFGVQVKVDKDTKIKAASDGEIIRIDHNYTPMTEEEFKEITAYNQTHPVTFVDRDFGGRQVWIDHKNGVVTSYNHMSSVSQNLKVGDRVDKGDVIGFVGNSGLMGEAKNNNDNIHLHFEIWIDGEFLGNDMKLPQIRKFLQYFFTENNHDK